LSRSELKEGEEAKILYQANTDCYVCIFSIAADGSVTLLLPNSTNRDNRILLDKAYEFPSAGSPVRLEAMFLPGFKGTIAEERIKIIATRKAEGTMKKTKLKTTKWDVVDYLKTDEEMKDSP
jgi:hypothetical protein